MGTWVALVAAAALAQAEPAGGAAGPAVDPAAAGAAKASGGTASGDDVAGAIELGMMVPVDSHPGELKVAGHLGFEWVEWRAGLLRLGFRVGMVGGGAGGDPCTGKDVSCGASGLYAGATASVAAVRRPVAAWLGVATSGFFLLADDWESHFSGLELGRVAAGLDFPSPWGKGAWLGAYASASYATIAASPRPLADSAGWTLGGGVRLTAGH